MTEPCGRNVHIARAGSCSNTDPYGFDITKFTCYNYFIPVRVFPDVTSFLHLSGSFGTEMLGSFLIMSFNSEYAPLHRQEAMPVSPEGGLE